MSISPLKNRNNQEKSRYSQYNRRQNSSHKFYTGMITSLNPTASATKLTTNTKGYFRGMEPHCQQYLKLKHDTFQKYNEMRNKKQQQRDRESKTKLQKKDDNSGKLQHMKQMEGNINLLDFKYPCIGYYQLKGYKKLKKDSDCTQKDNKQNNSRNRNRNKNRFIKKNKTQQNKLKMSNQPNYLILEKQFHKNQVQTQSVKIIQNLMKKYQERKKIKNLKHHTASSFSKLNCYELKNSVNTQQMQGLLISIPVSQGICKAYIKPDNICRSNTRQSQNDNNDQRTIKVMSLISNKVQNKCVIWNQKTADELSRISSEDQASRIHKFSKNDNKKRTTSQLQYQRQKKTQRTQ